MRHPRRLTTILVCLLSAIAARLDAFSGTFSLAWDPTTHSADGRPCTDLGGYRVYFGTAPGAYLNVVRQTAGNAVTVRGLRECTTWYFAVRAFDLLGNENPVFSNEISGWPAPYVVSSSPAAAEAGRTLVVSIAGANFKPGATLEFGSAGVAVDSVTVDSCTRITAIVRLGPSAAPGATDILITNPDGSHGEEVAGFRVEPGSRPDVLSTFPADGATGVSVSVRPEVRFNEAMLPESIGATSVVLLDPAGEEVAQAPGSPSLSPDGTLATITPAAALLEGSTYRIRVYSLMHGVRDLANRPLRSSFTQPLGFSTVPDVTPPTISEVGSSAVAATTARIAWTTDEPADGQVLYRKVGQIGYQATEPVASLAEAHAVDLEGLEPGTIYQYRVRSADGAGNASASSQDGVFTTLASPYRYLRFEAECGALTLPVQRVYGAGMFASSAITTPSGTSAGTAAAPSGTAEYGVEIPATDTWRLWLRIYGQDAASSSWFESIDGAVRQPVFASRFGTHVWVEGRSYFLTQGLHSLEIGGSDAMSVADRILLTNDPAFAPTERPVDDQRPPAAPVSFAGSPGDAQVALSWINPVNADFSKTVLRYRTDGRHPVSPLDGFAVAARPGTPGSADGLVHRGLANGTTYAYSAFAMDASGNASAAAHVRATPSAGP